MSASTGPTLAGFNTFVYNVMGISPLYLPTNSPIIGYAFTVAMAIVSPTLGAAAYHCQPGSQWSIYALAVYNLGGSNLINFAQDQPQRTYFADLRKTYGIAKFQEQVSWRLLRMRGHPRRS